MNAYDDFKIAERLRKFNLWAQILLGTLFVAGLNYVAARHYVKWDASAGMGNSLSPESAAYVRSLNAPVEIFVVISKGVGYSKADKIERDLRSLMERYVYASSSNKAGKISVTFVNPQIETKAAQGLVERFGNDIEDMVIVASGNNHKKIPIGDFYEESGDGQTRVFKGEQMVSSSLLNVSSGKVNKIYFLKGHGEMSFRASDPMRGLSELAGRLESRNYELAELDLSLTKRVPEDAGLLVIASPQLEILPREIEAIRKYLLKDNGNVAIFLGMGSLCGLEEILFEWGMRADDMLILDNSGDYESSSGDLIVRTFPERAHDIVRYFISSGAALQFGSTRPVREDLGAPMDENLKLAPLFFSARGTSWAEKSYQKAGVQKYDNDSDLPGPVPLGMAATRAAGSDLGVNIPGGKLVVFGDDNFIANRWFERLGNSKLALNTVGWMFDEDNVLNIPPRSLKTYSLTLSVNDTSKLALRFMILPSLVLLFGIAAYFVRKN